MTSTSTSTLVRPNPKLLIYFILKMCLKKFPLKFSKMAIRLS